MNGKQHRQRWKTKVVSGRISPSMYQAVLQIVKSGAYVDVTDYLRDIIRKDLENRSASDKPDQKPQ